MKLYQLALEDAYMMLTDEHLIAMNKADNTTGVNYNVLQKVMHQRGITVEKIIEIRRKKAEQKKSLNLFKRIMSRFKFNRIKIYRIGILHIAIGMP